MKSEEKTVNISEIYADYDWNSRSKIRALSEGKRPELEGDPDAPGIEGLALSLETDGQNTPVDVRQGGQGESRYLLVSGFRRFAAGTMLRDTQRTIAGLDSGKIRVRVHNPMNELEARKLNLRENIVRENLTPPDFVYAIKTLVREDPQLKAPAIAAMYAKSAGYISNCMYITKHLKDGVFSQWRESAVKPLPLDHILLIAKLPKAEQEEAYTLAVTPPSSGSSDDKSWVKAAVKRAVKNGTYLGALAREGLVTVAEDQDWEISIHTFVKFRHRVGGKEVGVKVNRQITNAFCTAYMSEKDRRVQDLSEIEGEIEDEGVDSV